MHLLFLKQRVWFVPDLHPPLTIPAVPVLLLLMIHEVAQGPMDWDDTSRQMVGMPPVHAGGYILYLPQPNIGHGIDHSRPGAATDTGLHMGRHE